MGWWFGCANDGRPLAARIGKTHLSTEYDSDSCARDWVTTDTEGAAEWGVE
jgi:hypothetical protein